MKISLKKGQDLSQLLLDQGVPARHLAEAAKQVAQLNQLAGVDKIKAGTTLEFPSQFTVGGKTFKLDAAAIEGLQQRTRGRQGGFDRTGIQVQAKQTKPKQQPDGPEQPRPIYIIAPGTLPGSGGDHPIYIIAPGSLPGSGHDGPLYIIAPDGRTRPGHNGPLAILPPPDPNPDRPLAILPPPGGAHDGPLYIIAPGGHTRPGDDQPIYILPPPGTGTKTKGKTKAKTKAKGGKAAIQAKAKATKTKNEHSKKS